MLAMTATRLDEPEMAVNFLLTDAKNFQFGESGMTPRLHVEGNTAPRAAGSADGPGYTRAAETYFPSMVHSEGNHAIALITERVTPRS